MIDREAPALSLSFGQFIQKARLAQGMTQTEVAQIANTTQTHLSKIELGKREPTLLLALAICDALHVNINDFVNQSHT